MVVPVVLPWLGLPCVAPPSPLLGALRPSPLGADVILGCFSLEGINQYRHRNPTCRAGQLNVPVRQVPSLTRMGPTTPAREMPAPFEEGLAEGFFGFYTAAGVDPEATLRDCNSAQGALSLRYCPPAAAACIWFLLG